MANSQPDRTQGYNSRYWQAVAKEMEKVAPPKPPRIGNWKPLNVPVNPLSKPVPPVKPAPKFMGKQTKKDR